MQNKIKCVYKFRVCYDFMNENGMCTTLQITCKKQFLDKILTDFLLREVGIWTNISTTDTINPLIKIEL